jgi:hypothetical protein
MLPHVAAVIARAAEGLGAAISGAADARLSSAVTSVGTCTRRLVRWCDRVHLRSSSWSDGLESITHSCYRVRILRREKVGLRKHWHRRQEAVTHRRSTEIIEGQVTEHTSISGVCVRTAVGVVWIQGVKEFLSKSLMHRRGVKFMRVRMARAQACWRQSFGRSVDASTTSQSMRGKGITAWC